MDSWWHRWNARKRKCRPKQKFHLHKTMTDHAIVRAVQRNVKIRDVIEGRARVEQTVDGYGRYITIVPKPPKPPKPPKCRRDADEGFRVQLTALAHAG